MKFCATSAPTPNANTSANPHFSPAFYSVCPKRRIGTPHRADTSDRDAASRCIALPRSVGSERRIAPERRPLERRPLHPCSRMTALWRILHDFSSVRALNIVVTMPAHPPNNVCRFRQTLLGVVAKVMQGTAFHRLATKAGEKCGRAPVFPIGRSVAKTGNLRRECSQCVVSAQSIAGGRLLQLQLRPGINAHSAFPVTILLLMIDTVRHEHAQQI